MVNDKIHSKNLLLKFKYCIRRLMVLKEVTIDLRLYIYMCPLYERTKSLLTIAYLQLFVKSNIVLGIH